MFDEQELKNCCYLNAKAWQRPGIWEDGALHGFFLFYLQARHSDVFLHLFVALLDSKINSALKTERVTHQRFRPCASADEILPAQAEVVVVLFPHARHPDAQLLLLRVRVIRKPAS